MTDAEKIALALKALKAVDEGVKYYDGKAGVFKIVQEAIKELEK